ncbi:MAG: SDR family oxidoreductase [Limnochordaceae bacterium]|nr:SDR family oxidoreductase [Limnochordaceae bacterium]
MKLQDRTAVVTGAGSGIGRAIALTLALEGARVMVTDLRPEWADEVASEIRQAGGEAWSTALDVTHSADAEAAVRAVVERWGRLDVWCNNAGVSSMKRFWELSEEDWDLNMAVNAKGVFLCSQAAARQMMRQQPLPGSELRGKIINVASMAGKRGAVPFLAHYVASKFAVVGLTQSMALELAPFKITVNAVCPGYVRTSMQEREVEWEGRLRGISPDEVRQLYIKDTPLGRLQTPEDVAAVVGFLASASADFMTGEAVNVNGGAWMD